MNVSRSVSLNMDTCAKSTSANTLLESNVFVMLFIYLCVRTIVVNIIITVVISAIVLNIIIIIMINVEVFFFFLVRVWGGGGEGREACV